MFKVILIGTEPIMLFIPYSSLHKFFFFLFSVQCLTTLQSKVELFKDPYLDIHYFSYLSASALLKVTPAQVSYLLCDCLHSQIFWHHVVLSIQSWLMLACHLSTQRPTNTSHAYIFSNACAPRVRLR